MLTMDKDLCKVKYVEDGVTFFYSSSDHLVKGLNQGGFGPIRMANYIIDAKGQFSKARTFNPEVANVLLAMGREEVNKFFDMMENI
ncbi:hypothetical protein ISREJYDI_CDS0035 [Pseudomonas phage UNO-G1W1]|jgi:hypothetical protein|uniref:Uncharacterized protein n=1 Tax=Pseudomonas phage UNO-G1W1 TaxID=3136609 RepID=A0AAX4MVB0_9CAUD